MAKTIFLTIVITILVELGLVGIFSVVGHFIRKKKNQNNN